MPQGEYYEDFIAALLCVGGFYIEKRIEMSEPINILELDVVSTKLSADCINKTLIEIKSGQWGMPDVFKVRGGGYGCCFSRTVFSSASILSTRF